MAMTIIIGIAVGVILMVITKMRRRRTRRAAARQMSTRLERLTS